MGHLISTLNVSGVDVLAPPRLIISEMAAKAVVSCIPKRGTAAVTTESISLLLHLFSWVEPAPFILAIGT
jgi:hypothetical protein